MDGWFSQLERRAIYRGAFNTVKELRDEIQWFIKTHNAHSAKPFKSANMIIDAINRAKQSLTDTTKQTGH